MFFALHSGMDEFEELKQKFKMSLLAVRGTEFERRVDELLEEYKNGVLRLLEPKNHDEWIEPNFKEE